jgi:hypothetical protein
MSHRIVVNNSGSLPMEFWLEPWGDGMEVPPGHSASIDFCPPGDLDLRVEATPGRVKLWVNAGEPCEDAGRLFSVAPDK